MLGFLVVSFFAAAALITDLTRAQIVVPPPATLPLSPSPPPSDYSSWQGKVPITDMNLPTPGCMDMCGRMCIDNPGQYFCSGQQTFVDTAEKKYDVGDAAK
jgi:hypothetical protein